MATTNPANTNLAGQKILAAMRAHPDAKIRATAERLAAIKQFWTAEELREVLLEMRGAS